MRKTIIAASIVATLGLAGCIRTEAGRAERDAYYGDKPAAVTCYVYGERSFDGFSTGKVIYDEGGRIGFVDRANGRYTVIEGDCRIVYATN